MESHSLEFAREAEERHPFPFRKGAQCGAICWRFGSDTTIEVLLITSGDTDYWAIPKGDIRRHELQHRCAQRQALEKAGVTGRIGKMPIGQYCHRSSSSWSPPAVLVHLLFVEAEISDFRPQGARQCVWLSAGKAQEMVREAELQELLRLIDSTNAPKFIANIRKTLTARGLVPTPREQQSHAPPLRASTGGQLRS
jgi:ADP-ribose pyrophosphatase YjhB (NUDIX family)